jgi:hypothetical protein
MDRNLQERSNDDRAYKALTPPLWIVDQPVPSYIDNFSTHLHQEEPAVRNSFINFKGILKKQVNYKTPQQQGVRSVKELLGPS